MNWFYVDAGQQAGPVDDAQLKELTRSGKIQPATLVWHEGLTEWRPYREVAPSPVPPPPPSEAAPPVLAAASAGVACSECGRIYPLSDVIRFGDRYVCAACKPLFFQRVREGAVPTGGGLGETVTEAELLARDYDVDIGSYFTRSWELFKANAGSLIGVSVLVYLALMATNIVPYVKVVLALIFTGPLMGGLWLVYIKTVRRQPAGVAEGFSGFGPRFWHMTLARLVPGLLGAAYGFLLVMLLMMTMPAFAAAQHGWGMFTPSSTFLVPLILAFLVIFVAMLYVNTCLMFALPLVSDKGLKFWPALRLSWRVVTKHWWLTFGLLFVCGLLGMAGCCACVVGALVTGPLAFLMLACHYQKVFGDLAPGQS